MIRGGRVGLGVAAILGCGPQVVVPEAETDTEGPMGTTGGPTSSTTVMSDSTRGDDDGEDDDADDDGVIIDDFPWTDFGGGTCTGDCSPKLDLLVVVDNSAGTGEEQAALTHAMIELVRDLEGLTDSRGSFAGADVQVMVTTTDVGNPLCTPFRPDGYDPAMGAPITEACASRLQNFTSLDGQVSVPQVCTDVCPMEIVPEDPFVAFSGTESDNVPDTDPVDLDGDGTPESPAAQALACLLPQGINGCGFEAPLEAMLQALNPMAAWNQGSRPFLRDDAALGIVVLTDEAECSVEDYAAMSDPAFQEIDPDTGQPSATSAICWNAGVTCDGPDAQGLYSGCTTADGPLQPLSRYTSYLGDYLSGDVGKTVFMVALLGVPPVTAHNPSHPQEPVAGGEFDLIVRDWIDGEYPVGDILPAEWAMGIDAERKTFLYGIGPACTGVNGQGGFTGQGIPNHRVMEVCHALDSDDGGARCAVESICANDYSASLFFVANMLTPPGG